MSRRRREDENKQQADLFAEQGLAAAPQTAQDRPRAPRAQPPRYHAPLPGAQPFLCDSCRAVIVHARTSNGKITVVDTLPDKFGEPYRDHFQTCDDPGRFSRRRNRGKRNK